MKGWLERDGRTYKGGKVRESETVAKAEDQGNLLISIILDERQFLNFQHFCFTLKVYRNSVA